MKIGTIGIDLAKSVFQVHGVDARGKAVLKKPLKRAQMTTFFANLPPCLVGMEACGGAHPKGHSVKSELLQFAGRALKQLQADTRLRPLLPIQILT